MKTNSKKIEMIQLLGILRLFIMQFQKCKFRVQVMISPHSLEKNFNFKGSMDVETSLEHSEVKRFKDHSIQKVRLTRKSKNAYTANERDFMRSSIWARLSNFLLNEINSHYGI